MAVADRLDITLVLPAFNEAAVITSTLEEAHAYLLSRGLRYEIIVAADGDDGTRELAAAADRRNTVQVIGSNQRGGKGRGIRQAVALARGDVIAFADADAKTPIAQLDDALAALDHAPIVIGSRELAETRIEVPQPWYRRVGSRGFGIVMHTLVGLRDIPDTQCGFKVFRGDVARQLFASQRIDGYMFDIEILCLARFAGHDIAQLPVHWRDDGDSRLELVAGNLRNLRDVWAIRRRMRGGDVALAPVVAFAPVQERVEAAGRER